MFLPPDVNGDDLLAYVRPLYPNGIFPLGKGWWIVLSAFAVILLVRLLVYYSPKSRRRREVFAAFDALNRSFVSNGNISMLAGELSVLIRRVALFRFGREQTAGLNGTLWTDFLKKTGADLDEQDSLLLSNQAYAPFASCPDRSKGVHLLNSVQKWLEHNL